MIIYTKNKTGIKMRKFFLCISLCLCAFTCVYTNAYAAENEDGATQDKVQVNNTQKAKRPKLHNRRPKFQSNDKIDSRRASLRMQLRRDAQAYRIDTNNQRHAAAGNDLYLAYKAAALDEDKEESVAVQAQRQKGAVTDLENIKNERAEKYSNWIKSNLISKKRVDSDEKQRAERKALRDEHKEAQQKQSDVEKSRPKDASVDNLLKNEDELSFDSLR